MANRIKCPVCHRPGTYCFDHRRCKYNMGTHYGPAASSQDFGVWCHGCGLYHRGDCPNGFRNTAPLNPRIAEHQDWMETDSRFAHACPDLDQEMPPLTREEFLEMVSGEELPEPFPTDMVNHPPHYNQCGIEAIDVIEAYASGNYHRGAALKYLLRADYKGSKLEDLRKAIWYIEREISRL